MTLENTRKRERLKRSVKNLIMILIFILMLLMIFSIYFKTELHALADNEKTTWYKNNAGLIKNNNFATSSLRSIGWGLLSICVDIASSTEKVFDISFGLIDFTQYKPVEAFIEKFRIVFVAVMALSLLWLGAILIISHEKRPKFMTNILIFFLVITCSTTFFHLMNKGVILFKDGVAKGGMSTVYEIVDSNMLDLIKVDNSGKGNSKIMNLNFNKNQGKGFYGNVIKGSSKKEKQKNFDLIDYNEVLNNENEEYGYSNDFKSLLSSKLINVNGKDVIVDVRNGFGWNSGDDADIGNEFYYRYNFNFIVGFIQVFALILIYLALSYKSIRVEFELVVARLLAYVYSAEISGGEKIKKIVIFIRDSYILLCINVVCLKIYALFSSYLATRESLPTLVSALFSLFIAFAVIDGPNLVEKLLGMDAGLRSSTARIIAVGGALKATAGMPAGAWKKAQGIGHGDINQGGVAGGVVGAMFGKDGTRDFASKGGMAGFNRRSQEKAEERAKNKETSNAEAQGKTEKNQTGTSSTSSTSSRDNNVQSKNTTQNNGEKHKAYDDSISKKENNVKDSVSKSFDNVMEKKTEKKSTMDDLK